jgi:hypothetical protein
MDELIEVLLQASCKYHISQIVNDEWKTSGEASSYFVQRATTITLCALIVCSTDLV